MFVIPAPGLKIVDPYKKDFLPAAGREVPDSDFYWHRMLRDADVTLGTAPAVVVSEAPAVAPAAVAKAATSATQSTEDRSAK